MAGQAEYVLSRESAEPDPVDEYNTPDDAHHFTTLVCTCVICPSLARVPRCLNWVVDMFCRHGFHADTGYFFTSHGRRHILIKQYDVPVRYIPLISDSGGAMAETFT